MERKPCNTAEEEMPSLTNSDTSGDGHCDESPRDVLNYNNDDDNDSYCSNSSGFDGRRESLPVSDYDDELPPTDADNDLENNAIDRSNRTGRSESPSSISPTSPPPPPSSRQQRERSTSRSRSHSRSRQRSHSQGRSRSSSRARSTSRARSSSRSRSSKQRGVAPPPPPPQADPPADPPCSQPTTSTRAQQQQRQQQQQRTSRFSYARRASLGGTTIYRTPHMATLDSHLRSTSGLRLQTDGTCNFLFENQRFVIEATEDTGDFLFYASFGALRDLQQGFSARNGGRNLLRMLALWNEELKQRSSSSNNLAGGNNGGGGAGGSVGGSSAGGSSVESAGHDKSGLLRIDSSKTEGPHVAFIYYGHVDDIKSSTHLQETLDDFVDDALEFFGKLNGVREDGSNHNEPVEAIHSANSSVGSGGSNGRAPPMEPQQQCQQSRQRSPPGSLRTSGRELMSSITRQLTSSQTSSNKGSSTRQLSSSQTSSNKGSSFHEQDPEPAYREPAVAATTVPVATPATTTTTTAAPSASSIKKSALEGAVTSTDIYNQHLNKPTKIFTKMIQSIRKKSTKDNKDDETNSGAENNMTTPEEGSLKPKINLSRKNKGVLLRQEENIEQQPQIQQGKSDSPTRRGSSFVDNDKFDHQMQQQMDEAPIPRRGSSFHTSSRGMSNMDDRFRGGPVGDPRYPIAAQRGRSFHVGDGNSSIYNNKISGYPYQKGRSFHVGDEHGSGVALPMNNGAPRKNVSFREGGAPHRRSASFVTDDYSGRSNYPPTRQSTSFHHQDDGHRKQSRSTSFHADSDHYYNDNHHPVRSKSFHHGDAMVNTGNPGRGLNQSKPIVSRRHSAEPPPSQITSSSCRGSSQTGGGGGSSSQHLHRPPQRCHTKQVDDDNYNSRENSSSRHRSHSKSRSSRARMNNSEPVLSSHAERKN